MWPTESCTGREGDQGEVFALAPGVELLGEDHSGGFQQQRYLVRRGDGQIAQLPRVLYLVATAIDGRRDNAAVACQVQHTLEQQVSTEQIDFLVQNRLLPAGILAADRPGEIPRSAADAPANGKPGAPAAKQAAQRADHLLTLRHRKAVVPATTVWTIAGVFGGLYRRVIVITGLLAFLTVDGMILARLGFAELRTSAQHLLAHPVLALLVIGLVIVAGMFHECGHVAACRYSGATPGPMGVGLYLVWPAFYSSVTDAYRLGRGGRLRTDLGGVYFNALALASIGGAYLVTGWPWLLAALVVLHLDTAWQFLPSLRFDGYYILADLVGVPDLFNRIGPILTNVLPTRPTSPRVTELKPWVRRVVSAWVVLVIPFLAGALTLLVAALVRLFPTAGESLALLLSEAQQALFSGRLAVGVLALGQAAMLILPMVGGTIVLVNLTRRLMRTATDPLLRGRGARLVRTVRSSRAGQLTLVGGAVVLLARLGAVTHGDIAVLTTAAIIVTSLVIIVMSLETSAAVPLLAVTVAAMSTSQLAVLVDVPTPTLLITAGQALTLAGLAVPTRVERLRPFVRALLPFTIGLGMTVIPLVSLLAALLAVPLVTRTYRRTPPAGGHTGRHRRSIHTQPRRQPQPRPRPEPKRAVTQQKGSLY